MATRKKPAEPMPNGEDADDLTSGKEAIVREIVDLGVPEAAKYADEVIEMMTGEGLPRVSDIFPRFSRDPNRRALLKALRQHRIVRPRGGGQWSANSTILLASKGVEISERYDRMRRPLVFISYSHADEAWRNRVVEHFKVLESLSVLDTWYDDQIEVGADWKSDITEALARARAAVLLISSSFLGSDFIRDEEAPRMFNREGFRVFPILVRPCAWELVSWLQAMQVRPRRALSGGTEHEIDEHLAQITREIAALLSAPS